MGPGRPWGPRKPRGPYGKTKICSFTSEAMYLRIKFKNEIEQFLQLLPVVPRALPHRYLPNQTRKESI